MTEFPKDEALADLLTRYRTAIGDQLAHLEWMADAGDRTRLISDPQTVRPRVDLFLDALIDGLSSGNWDVFDNAIGNPTIELLNQGVRTAQVLVDRSVAIVATMVPYVGDEPNRDELLVSLFRIMQAVSGGIVASHHETLLRRSRELNDVKSLFMQLAGHELRNPLTVAAGYADMIADGSMGEMPSRVADAAQRIHTSSTAALTLVDGLSEMASLVESDVVLRCDWIALDDLVDRAVAVVQYEADAKGVAIDRDIPAAVVEVDPHRCVIALRNLLSNAVKYGNADAVVRVSATVGEGHVLQLCVDNVGPQIPEAERELIFQRSYRSLDSIAAEIPGSGLGLYIVKRIAELHGGDVALVAEPGHGSRFLMTLPVAVKSADAAASPLPSATL